MCLLRAAVLELLLGVLHKPAPGAARIGGPAKSGNAAKQDVSMAVLSQLHALLSAHGDVALRHLAFMALMRLGGLAPTLFREEEDFAVAGECFLRPVAPSVAKFWPLIQY